LALFSFFELWVGYARFARIRGKLDKTLIATTNTYLQSWMLQATALVVLILYGHEFCSDVLHVLRD